MTIRPEDQALIEKLLTSGKSDVQSIQRGLVEEGHYSQLEAQQAVLTAMDNISGANSTLGGIAKEGVQGVGNLLGGIGAGLGQSVVDILNLPHAAGLTPKVGYGPFGDTPSDRDSTMYGLGKGMERVGEFTLGGEAAQGLIKGKSLLTTLGRIGAQGAAGAGVSTIHNPTDGGQIAWDAATGAAGGAVGEGLEASQRILASHIPEWYKGHLNLPKSVSPKDSDKLVQIGLDNGLAVGSRKSLDRVGEVYQPGTILGDLHKEVEDNLDTIDPRTGAEYKDSPVNIHTVLRPLMDEIAAARDPDRILLNPTSSGKDYLSQLNSELREIITGWGGAVNKRTGGITSLPPSRSVLQTHLSKKEIYSKIKPSTYSDVSDAIATARERAQTLLALGEKNAINDVVPGVAVPNELIHNTLQLRDALDSAYKSRPSEMGTLIKFGIAGLAGGSVQAITGSHLAGSGIAPLTLIAIHHILTNPQTASRMAILFHNNPQITSAIGALAKTGIWGARQGLSSPPEPTNQPLNSLFQPPAQ
jgi:hypothetical protein